jgi:hypothetical protein
MASTGNGQDSGLPSSLAGALALLVAALAALGLTGAALLRAVRNNPDQVSNALTWAVLGGAVVALAQILVVVPPDTSQITAPPKTITTKITTAPGEPEKVERTETETIVPPPEKVDRPWWRKRGPLRALRQALTALGIVLLVISLIMGTKVGASAVSDREGPLISLQAGSISTVPGATNLRDMEVTVSVKAVGMSTSNDVAVQVVGLRQLGTQVNRDNVQACENNHTWNSFEESQGGYELKTEVGSVLSWNRLGPDSAGSVDASWKLQVPLGRYAGVCAWAVFGGDLQAKLKDKSKNLNNTSAAYMRLGSQTTA